MMDRAMEELDRAKARMAGDLRAMVTEGEEFVKAAAIEAKLKSVGYVRANPWTTIGVAIAAGALIGFLVAKR
jgi:ElaB/YqjD/DUF883 family membrane-anchored ribosome-binding protein